MNIGIQARERRVNSRFELLEYSMITSPDGNQSRGVVVDVSLGGLQVRSRNAFQSGSMCTLQIGRLGASPLTVEAEARYCGPVEDSDLFSTGFRVSDLNPEQRLAWADFVHSVFRNRMDDGSF